MRSKEEPLASLLGEGAGSWHSESGSSDAAASSNIGSESPPVAAHPAMPTAGIVWVLPAPKRREAVGPYSSTAAEARRGSQTSALPPSALKQKRQTSS